MPVEYRKGDLFDQTDVDALGHGVNCKGAMGAGIAVEFKNRFPDMYREYHSLCKRGGLTVGDLFPWYDEETDYHIYNMATQHNWGKDARYEAVESSLGFVLAHMVENDVESLALPQIGAGIGGLSWPKVAGLIEEVSDESDRTIVLVEWSK